MPLAYGELEGGAAQFASGGAAAGAASTGLMASMGPIGIGLGLASLVMGAKKNKIQAPPPRSYIGEMQGAVRAQNQLAPELAASDLNMSRLYQGLQRDTMMGQMGVMEDLYNAYTPVGQRLAGQNLDAFAPMYGAAAQYGTQAMRQGVGSAGMGLLDTMNMQAQQGLDYGRDLSPQEMTYAQQSARSAMGARGLNMSGMGIANEILNTYKVRNDREARARQFAQSTYGLNQGLASLGGQLYGQSMNNLVAPLTAQGLLGQSSTYQQLQGPQFAQPESQYNANIMGSNQNVGLQTNMANAQTRAGITSGLMSMVGSLGGGYMQGRGQAGLPLFG